MGDNRNVVCENGIALRKREGVIGTFGVKTLRAGLFLQDTKYLNFYKKYRGYVPYLEIMQVNSITGSKFWGLEGVSCQCEMLTFIFMTMYDAVQLLYRGDIVLQLVSTGRNTFTARCLNKDKGGVVISLDNSATIICSLLREIARLFRGLISPALYTFSILKNPEIEALQINIFYGTESPYNYCGAEQQKQKSRQKDKVLQEYIEMVLPYKKAMEWCYKREVTPYKASPRTVPKGIILDKAVLNVDATLQRYASVLSMCLTAERGKCTEKISVQYLPSSIEGTNRIKCSSFLISGVYENGHLVASNTFTEQVYRGVRLADYIMKRFALQYKGNSESAFVCAEHRIQLSLHSDMFPYYGYILTVCTK